MKIKALGGKKCIVNLDCLEVYIHNIMMKTAPDTH